jgi:uncharacterized caspase-like protein
MKRGLPVLFLLAIACAPVASAQADGCRGALSALNRVKEEITPKLSADTEFGKQRLAIMQSTLERATHVCPDFAELWYYRMAVSERLGQASDAAYAKKKVVEFQYEGQFDPFKMPPAALSPEQATRARSSKVRQKWALVVGIDSFQDKRLPGLRFAVKDSTDFASFLKDPNGGRFDPAHVVHLENGDATLQGIRRGLGELRVKAQPDDLVVVYVASHGSPREIDPNGVSYIATNDTNLDDAATLYATSLQMIDLVQQINREIRAQRVVLILDTCFSGDALTSLDAGVGSSGAGNSSAGIAGNGSSGARGFGAGMAKNPPKDAPASAAFSEAFQNLKIGYGRAVITASRANEESWESAQIKNGYFTHYLLDILRAGHGNDNLDHVFTQVRTTVSARVKQDQGADQNPSFELSEGADSIVIGVPESL